MSIRKLAEHFDKPNRQLCVNIRTIAKKITDLLSGHEIFYCPQEKIKEYKTPLYGMLEQRERVLAYSSDTGVDNYVHYDNCLPNELKRLVVCKELIHILDPDCYLTKTSTDVSSLVVNVSTPKGMQEGDANQAKHDRLAITMAVGILFPLSIRAQFLQDFNNKKITSSILANRIGIPYRYVDKVMEESWPDFYNSTLNEAEAQFE